MLNKFFRVYSRISALNSTDNSSLFTGSKRGGFHIENQIKNQIRRIFIVCLVLLATAQTGAASPVAEYLKLSTEVNDGYAITTVEEKLSNPADTAVEDRFSFLIPEEAFISGFSLTIDGEEYTAEVLEKEEASRRFDTAASEGRAAGLLETKEQNLFSYALSFEPGQNITVKLTYEQALKKTLGEYELVQFLDSGKSAGDLSVTVNINSENQLTRLEAPDFPAAEIEYLSANRGQVRYATDSLLRNSGSCLRPKTLP